MSDWSLAVRQGDEFVNSWGWFESVLPQVFVLQTTHCGDLIVRFEKSWLFNAIGVSSSSSFGVRIRVNCRDTMSGVWFVDTVHVRSKCGRVGRLDRN